MKRLAWAVALLVPACTPDVDLYPVQPSRGTPAVTSVVEAPDAAVDAPTQDGGLVDGGPGLPITDGGMFSQDAGGTPADAAVPPFP